jgi:hypothetical protein
LEIGNISGGKVCHVRAIHPGGSAEFVASWRVRPEGYTGSQKMTVDGSIATAFSDIEAFDVVTTSGQRLVKVTI